MEKEKYMSQWIMWILAAGVLLILEMFTGTLYLLMMSIGLVAGGVAALAGASLPGQFLIASIVGIVATFGLRRSKFGRLPTGDASRDPNVNLDIGQTLIIDGWRNAGNETYTARAMYRGAMWDVDLQSGEAATSGQFIIREVRGSRLVVANARSGKH
jgi:membrane protein implicated in regulation of membrane protease activity